MATRTGKSTIPTIFRKNRGLWTVYKKCRAQLLLKKATWLLAPTPCYWGKRNGTANALILLTKERAIRLLCSTNWQNFLEDVNVPFSVSLTHLTVQNWINESVHKGEHTDDDNQRVINLSRNHTVEVYQLKINKKKRHEIANVCF